MNADAPNARVMMPATSGTRHVLDLTAALERIKAELRAELLVELHAEADKTAWPPWMNVNTAAKYLDVPAERLRKLVARRQIPYVQEAPNCKVQFSRQDLDGYMNTHRHPRP